MPEEGSVIVRATTTNTTSNTTTTAPQQPSLVPTAPTSRMCLQANILPVCSCTTCGCEVWLYLQQLKHNHTSVINKPLART